MSSPTRCKVCNLSALKPEQRDEEGHAVLAGRREAYRVVKEGGLACMIGPVHPTFWLSRFFADM